MTKFQIAAERYRLRKKGNPRQSERHHPKRMSWHQISNNNLFQNVLRDCLAGNRLCYATWKGSKYGKDDRDHRRPDR